MKRSLKGNRNQSHFWAGGCQAYEDGLREHYETELTRLRDRLKSAANDLERAELRDEIKRTRTEYKQKVRETGKLIF